MTKYDVASNLVIAGLDGFKGVLSAKQQRELFGYVPYGKKTVNIDCSGQGRVYGFRIVSFGTDSERFEHDFQRIAERRVSF